MRKSPLMIVKEKFGDKQKLVEAVQKFVKNEDLWVSHLNEKKGLDCVSNAKLLRLLNVFTTVQSKWGTREGLVNAILTEEKRTKDIPYKTKMMTYPVPRLYDYYKSAAKRAKNAAAKAAKK